MILLQELPPLQRAVLILRDVLGFTAAEASLQLETTVASVTSALQRARATAQRRAAEAQPAGDPARARRPGGRGPRPPVRDRARDGRRRRAAGAADRRTPPGACRRSSTWFQGHQALRAWLVRDPLSMRWRHRVVQANGQLAVAGYLLDSDSGRYLAARHRRPDPGRRQDRRGNRVPARRRRPPPRRSPPSASRPSCPNRFRPALRAPDARAAHVTVDHTGHPANSAP